MRKSHMSCRPYPPKAQSDCTSYCEQSAMFWGHDAGVLTVPHANMHELPADKSALPRCHVASHMEHM